MVGPSDFGSGSWATKKSHMIESRENPYLEQEVFSASPAKLRWLLINKGVQLTKMIDQLWQDKDPAATQYTLWLRDVLNELLSAVHGQDGLAKKVADLYVFMAKLLASAEQKQSLEEIRELRSLLEIEAETWQLVQQSQSSAVPVLTDLPATPADGGFCLDA